MRYRLLKKLSARKPLMTGYLINHKLKIHLDNDIVTGLYADIECPHRQLHGNDNSVANDLPPMRVKIKTENDVLHLNCSSVILLANVRMQEFKNFQESKTQSTV